MLSNRGLMLSSGSWGHAHVRPAPFFSSLNSSTVDVAAGNSRTFSSVNIGTPDSKRLVVVHGGLGGTVGAAQIGVTVNGVTADLILSAAGAQGIFTALVPTGTLVDIVLTNNSGAVSARQMAGVFVCYPDDPVAIEELAGSAGTTTNAVISDIAVVAGGFVVWGYEQYNTAGTVSVTWTGAEAVNESYDTTLETSTWAGGYVLPLTDNTTADMTAAESTSGFKELLVCSWGP